MFLFVISWFCKEGTSKYLFTVYVDVIFVNEHYKWLLGLVYIADIIYSGYNIDFLGTTESVAELLLGLLGRPFFWGI